MLKLSEKALRWAWSEFGEFKFNNWDEVRRSEESVAERKRTGRPKYTLGFERKSERRKGLTSLDLMFNDNAEYVGFDRPKDIKKAEWQMWELEALAWLMAHGYVEVINNAD